MAFVHFVPARKQPSWVTEARLLPLVQSTAAILRSVISDHPGNPFASRSAMVEQAPPQIGRKARPDGGHDPMAELIRKNEAAVPTMQVQQKSAGIPAKTYGAGDRQALDKLVQTGGNR
jgi:hypothetical protein